MKNRVFGWLIGLLAALVLLYLVATWYVGNASQDRINSFVSQLNQEIASQWNSSTPAPEIKIIDYKRGLLTSLVTYQVDYYKNQLSADKILLADKLDHGPFPWTALANGNFKPMVAYSKIKPMHNGAMQPWFDLMSADEYPWRLENQYYFDGAADAVMVLTPFADSARQLDFQGGQVMANYHPADNQITVQGQLAGLLFTEPETSTVFDLTEMDFSMSTVRGAKQDTQLHQQVQIATLQARWPDGFSVTLGNPAFAIDSAHIDQLADSKITYDLGQVIVGDTDIGKLRAILTLERMNTGVLQEILDFLGDLDIDTDNIYLQQVKDAELQLLLKKMFASSPAVALENLQWQTASSSSEVDFRLDFQPVTGDDFDSYATVLDQSIKQFGLNFMLAKDMFLDVLKTQFDENSVQLFNMLFDHYAAGVERQGLVVIKDRAISSNLNYANGLFTVNGNVMSPADFGQRLGSIISP